MCMRPSVGTTEPEVPSNSSRYKIIKLSNDPCVFSSKSYNTEVSRVHLSHIEQLIILDKNKFKPCIC